MKPSIDDMASFCRRKGLVYNSSEIYGGLAGFFDYGPYGVELKKNILNEWWNFMVSSRQNVVGIDGSLISHQNVWKASGHLSGFSDIILECSKCSFSTRADHFIEEKTKKSFAGNVNDIKNSIKKHKLTCPKCRSEFKEPKEFNLMFPVYIGPEQNSKSIAYLRGETCQMIYLNFKSIQENSRLQLPFGIAQTGKAFRNEISPRNFLFRMREFEQLEMQFFVKPGETKKWFESWKKQRLQWYLSLGIKKSNLRFRPHKKHEMAHYAKKAEDIEYKFPFGFKEVEGIHDRGNWDLSSHMKHSNKNLTYFDEKSGEKIIPHIVETSAGLDRLFLMFLYEAYNYDKKRDNVVLKLHPKLAPIKIGIFPLVSKDNLPKKALEVYSLLKDDFICFYDESGSIGRRYARQDELGTPFCITIDHDSLKKNDVTIRNRDDQKQIRVKIHELNKTLRKLLNKN